METERERDRGGERQRGKEMTSSDAERFETAPLTS